MLWRFFQTAVFIAACSALIYWQQNDPTLPKNGYANGLLALGAAWGLTALLSWCLDLPTRARASFQRRKERRHGGAARGRNLVERGQSLIG